MVVRVAGISFLLGAFLAISVYELGGGGFVPGLKKCNIVGLKESDLAYPSPKHCPTCDPCPAPITCAACPAPTTCDPCPAPITCDPCPAPKTCAPCPVCDKKSAEPKPGLQEIFDAAGTDKGSSMHGYYRYYDRILAPLRAQPDLKMLEIGVDSEKSITAWRKYFESFKRIVGIAYQTSLKENAFDEEKKTSFYVGSQDNATFLKEICQKEGPFDLIIDDGSHIPEHQIASFEGLMSCVKEGGLYVIEDIETSYWTKPGASLYGYPISNVGIGSKGSVVERFKGVADVINRKYMLNFSYSVLKNDNQVVSMEFNQNMIVLRRGTDADVKYNGKIYIHAHSVDKNFTVNKAS